MENSEKREERKEFSDQKKKSERDEERSFRTSGKED